MSIVKTLWDKTHGLPLGKRVFSTLVSQKAPYFASIHPRFVELRPHYAELVIPDRRSVRNHIGTVHAIALCNGAEAAMGMLAEVTIPSDLRWIPKGMQVSYTAKAGGDITCIAETAPDDWKPGDVPVRVRAVRGDGTVVLEGVITIYVSAKPARAAASA
jgi:acyl-coenzyme A thioesterase PaaI-like protein